MAGEESRHDENLGEATLILVVHIQKMARELGEKCNSIFPLIPAILDILKQTPDEVSADDFVLAEEEFEEDINRIINELASLYSSKKSNADILEIKFACINSVQDISVSAESTVAKAITKILFNAEPPLLKNDMTEKLFTEYKSDKAGLKANAEKCGYVLGEILDELPRRNYEVLATLCSYVRDYSSDKKKVCKFLSCGIFGDISAKKASTASGLLRLLVNNAEAIFGKMAALKLSTIV